MKKTYLNRLLSLIFGIAIFLFFAFYYPFHLNYQEQFQLFLFSGDYLLSYLKKPGGFADYAGNFITQFYFYSWFGAMLIALLLVLLQRLVWQILYKLNENVQLFYPLTFLPPILYWSLLCDENYLIGGLVSLIYVTIFMLIFTSIKRSNIRLTFYLIAIPILFWIAGGAFILFSIFGIAIELLRKEKSWLHWMVGAGVAILLSIACPILSKYYLVQYPMMQVVTGVNFYRFPVTVPYSILLIGFLMVALPFVSFLFSKKIDTKTLQVLLVLQLVTITLFGFFFIRSSADKEKEEVMAYDFYVRMRKWDKIIDMADKKQPPSPLSVSCLNLALAQHNLLAERMFSYYQNGVGGLLPDFARDFTIPTIVGEIYYHLGFVNTAQRFAFEAMEALPDYQKSARSVMRLAETNIINGNYEVAKKYLHLLQKTFYYKKWANNALVAIQDEKMIEEHPEWGWLRKVRTKEDFLFSEGEREQMLGVVFRQNHDNRMAFEYLMACCLLKKDLQHFMDYFPLAKSLNYKVIPKSYQEALIYVWGLTNTDPTRDIPYPISNVVRNRVLEYGKIYTNRPDAEAMLQPNYSDTYWYYLHYSK